MPALQHDAPQLNQSTFAHSMMAAMSEYLDAVAIGNTEIGRARLHLAQSFADDAVKATERDYPAEYDVAEKFRDGLRRVRLV